MVVKDGIEFIKSKFLEIAPNTEIYEVVAIHPWTIFINQQTKLVEFYRSTGCVLS